MYTNHSHVNDPLALASHYWDWWPQAQEFLLIDLNNVKCDSSYEPIMIMKSYNTMPMQVYRCTTKTQSKSEQYYDDR